jgi:YbgC/YbaW family acyl-CoA thioester hydrolase
VTTVTDFYRVNVRVHWADTDAAGIVWFGNFLRFFEEAEDEMFRALGRTRLELIRDFGILMPRVEAGCKYRAPARAEEVLAIGIGVHEMTERRISYLFEARKGDTNGLVCEGSYRVACVSADTFKPRDFPPAMRLLMNRLPSLIDDQRADRRRTAAGWA